MSFPESGEAGEESFCGRTGLHSCNRYSHGKLQLTSCDWGQFLEVGQWPKDRYDSVNGIFVSPGGMEEDDDHTRLVIELSTLIKRLWIEGRRVQTQAIPSMKVLPVRKAGRGAADRGVVRGSADSWSSSSSASEQSELGEGVSRSGSAGGRKGLPDGRVRDDRSKKGGCSEP